MNTSYTVLFTILASAIVVRQVEAHHSFAPVYDAKRTIFVEGGVYLVQHTEGHRPYSDEREQESCRC